MVRALGSAWIDACIACSSPGPIVYSMSHERHCMGAGGATGESRANDSILGFRV